MVGIERVTVDDVIELIDERHRTSDRVRAHLVLAGGIVALADWTFQDARAPVLLWVPLVAGAVLAGHRAAAGATIVTSSVIGAVSLLGSAPAGAVAAEVVVRAGGLLAVWLVVSWVTATGRELARRARTDPATGLLNRAGFEAALERERERARRSDMTLSLVYLDVDGLKQANDRHGHAVGDEILARFAAHLGKTCRTVDVAARLGGDEFALLLPDTDAPGVARLLHRLFQTLGQDPGCLPVSAGAVTWMYPPSADDMMVAADQAMYSMKRRGGSSWTLVDADRLITTQGTSRPPDGEA